MNVLKIKEGCWGQGREKYILMSIRGQNMPMSQIIITNMGEFMLPITETEIKDLGFVKLHGHDLNSTREMILVMFACMKCIINRMS